MIDAASDEAPTQFDAKLQFEILGGTMRGYGDSAARKKEDALIAGIRSRET